MPCESVPQQVAARSGDMRAALEAAAAALDILIRDATGGLI